MQQPQHDEACLPLNDENYLHIDDGSDSTSDSDADSLFDHSDNEAASDTGSESLLEEVDNNTDNDDNDLFDGEDDSGRSVIALRRKVVLTRLRTIIISISQILETGKKINGMVQVLKVITKEKELNNIKRESTTIYVEDLAKFARVLLTIREMTFPLSITGNRPEALV
ncbi:hypothetical protein F5882DRAFT_387412 [Hyaloscypha sp. PMI_1271]|nr:hypothetical protein F5882DRAFT_387412 [Hyaloscypha sp. PMI_1271]